MDMREDIIDIIQNKVNKLAKEKYKDDTCPPIFTVSIIQRRGEEGLITDHDIGLTIQHNGLSFTRVIFPVLCNHYGYPPLLEEMVKLYNNTM